MAGHDLVILIQHGNESDGWRLDNTAVETLFATAGSDKAVVEATKDMIRVGFRDQLSRTVGTPAVDSFLEAHVSEVV